MLPKENNQEDLYKKNFKSQQNLVEIQHSKGKTVAGDLKNLAG